jgi:ribosome-binding protein aMBF1 (putative translation factor)
MPGHVLNGPQVILDSFGKILKECREAKGLSQSELARQLDTHHSIIGKYERDEVKPSIDVVKKNCRVARNNRWLFIKRD